MNAGMDHFILDPPQRYDGCYATEALLVKMNSAWNTSVPTEEVFLVKEIVITYS